MSHLGLHSLQSFLLSASPGYESLSCCDGLTWKVVKQGDLSRSALQGILLIFLRDFQTYMPSTLVGGLNVGAFTDRAIVLLNSEKLRCWIFISPDEEGSIHE